MPVGTGETDYLFFPLHQPTRLLSNPCPQRHFLPSPGFARFEKIRLQTVELDGTARQPHAGQSRKNRAKADVFPAENTGRPGSMLAVRSDSNLRQGMRIYEMCSKCNIFAKCK